MKLPILFAFIISLIGSQTHAIPCAVFFQSVGQAMKAVTDKVRPPVNYAEISEIATELANNPAKLTETLDTLASNPRKIQLPLRHRLILMGAHSIEVRENISKEDQQGRPSFESKKIITPWRRHALEVLEKTTRLKEKYKIVREPVSPKTQKDWDRLVNDTIDFIYEMNAVKSSPKDLGRAFIKSLMRLEITEIRNALLKAREPRLEFKNTVIRQTGPFRLAIARGEKIDLSEGLEKNESEILDPLGPFVFFSSLKNDYNWEKAHATFSKFLGRLAAAMLAYGIANTVISNVQDGLDTGSVVQPSTPNSARKKRDNDLPAVLLKFFNPINKELWPEPLSPCDPKGTLKNKYYQIKSLGDHGDPGHRETRKLMTAMANVALATEPNACTSLLTQAPSVQLDHKKIEVLNDLFEIIKLNPLDPVFRTHPKQTNKHYCDPDSEIDKFINNRKTAISHSDIEAIETEVKQLLSVNIVTLPDCENYINSLAINPSDPPFRR